MHPDKKKFYTELHQAGHRTPIGSQIDLRNPQDFQDFIQGTEYFGG